MSGEEREQGRIPARGAGGKQAQVSTTLAAPAVLTTRRLILRELVVPDWKAIHAYESLPQVRRFLLPGQGTQDQVLEHVLGSIAAVGQQPRTYYCLGLVLRAQPELIGTCSIAHVLPGEVASIGWALDPRHWGQGLVPEAARALVSFAFEQRGVRAVQARCDPANHASIRVMEKLGMRRQELRLLERWRIARSYGLWWPIVGYMLTREEWQAQREGGPVSCQE